MKAHHSRGFSLLETLIAASIGTVVMGTAIAVYGTSTRSFYRDSSQTYVQNRVRSELSDVAKDIRCSKAVLPKVTVNGTVYYAASGQNTPYGTCLVLLVPSQDDSGLFYFGSTDPGGTPYPGANTLVNDLVIYYYGNGNKLYRTVVPNVYVSSSYVATVYTSVKAADGAIRSSYRPAESNVLVAQNMAQFKLKFRDKDGNVIPSPSVKGASVDATAKVVSDAESTISMTGVRLRNMRSASIYGLVSPATEGVKVEAIVTGSYSAYPIGTVVGSCLTTAEGAYEVFGLVGGKYKLRFTTPSGQVSTSTNTFMDVEDEKPFNAGTHALTLS
jgi:type II secretory pathway pseudopilin PulG